MQNSHGADTASTIAIADAVALLEGKLEDVAKARQVLVDRAQMGDLLAVAARAHGPFDGESLDEHGWQIPADLWRRLGNHSDDEWRRGDLTATQDSDRFAELQEDFGSPLKLIGVRVVVAGLNSILDALPVDWVSAHFAIEMLSPNFSKQRAGKALAKRAHSGLVKTRAGLFKWEEPTGGSYGNSGKVERVERFADLPIKFWWAEGHEALEQNWVTGDFATWIEKTYYWQAFGTEFARCDIAAMLPTAATSASDNSHEAQPAAIQQAAQSASSSHSGDPGRPPKGAQLYFAEFERRLANGECLAKIGDEAKALLDWLKREHPTAACPSVKTITNRIRQRHNAQKTMPENSA